VGSIARGAYLVQSGQTIKAEVTGKRNAFPQEGTVLKEGKTLFEGGKIKNGASETGNGKEQNGIYIPN